MTPEPTSAPLAGPTPEVLAAIADRYGVRVEAIREVPGGVANHAFALGDDLFLRIPRTEEFERDLHKEVAVIPVARSAGVRTPAIVDFDATRTLVDAPYMVIEQLHGTDLIAAEQAEPPDARFWQDLGNQVALLHQVPQTPLDGVPTDDGGGDPRPTVERLATLGYLDPGTADWLIDWGDAAWGPPGMEFAKLPLEQVAATLPAYTDQSDSKSDGQLEAAALWFHLSWASAESPSRRDLTSATGRHHPPAGYSEYSGSSPRAPRSRGQDWAESEGRLLALIDGGSAVNTRVRALVTTWCRLAFRD